MKFQNGAWLMKEGHALFSPKMLYEIDKAEDSITLVMPTKGFDLQSVMLTVKVSAPMPEMLRVQVCHYDGVDTSKQPKFELNLPETSALNVDENDKELVISS